MGVAMWCLFGLREVINLLQRRQRRRLPSFPMVTGFPSGEKSLCFSFYPEVMNAVQRDLVDPFGRVIRDLRISVTDRCNFRCTYCMPEEGMEWLHRDDVLSFEEIERISALFVQRFGVEGIRLTGGEPTVRAGIVTLVEKLSHP